MPLGPTSITHRQRQENADAIIASLTQFYGAQLMGVGLYGSLATGTDGPFSDIEMVCVIEGTNHDQTLEWCAGDWKAEVGICSINVLLKDAAKVEPSWSQTHGCFARVKAVYDPTNLFLHVKKTAISQPEAKFRHAIRELLVGDVFELVGKIRNTALRQYTAPLPGFAVNLARYAAWLSGLANRHLYSTSARMLEESLHLDSLPRGHFELINQVMSGKLDESAEIIQLCEAYWDGVITWTQGRNLRLVTSLDELLALQKQPS